MPYQSNLSAVQEQMNRARDAGLVAAGEVYRTALKQNLRGGYKTGFWVTGETLNSIKITVPYDGADGRGVSVYTELMTALYWFAGHNNIFTRKFERVDKWTQPMVDTAPEQVAAFERTYRRFMGA